MQAHHTLPSMTMVESAVADRRPGRRSSMLDSRAMMAGWVGCCSTASGGSVGSRACCLTRLPLLLAAPEPERAFLVRVLGFCKLDFWADNGAHVSYNTCSPFICHESSRSTRHNHRSSGCKIIIPDCILRLSAAEMYPARFSLPGGM